jgi:hypothetical protein
MCQEIVRGSSSRVMLHDSVDKFSKAVFNLDCDNFVVAYSCDRFLRDGARYLEKINNL